MRENKEDLLLHFWEVVLLTQMRDWEQNRFGNGGTGFMFRNMDTSISSKISDSIISLKFLLKTTKYVG